MSEPSTGKHCYLVLAHTDPEGVLRLVRRIRELSDADVIVRYEQPDLLPVDEMETLGAHCLISTIPARWGDWTLVEAALELAGKGLDTSAAGYFSLLSGQDYPIRRLADWEADVRSEGADALLSLMRSDPGEYRYRWHIVPASGARHAETLPYRAARHAGYRLGQVLRPVTHFFPSEPGRGPERWWVGVRRPPWARTPPVPLRKASQWLTISRRGLERVLTRHRTEPRLAHYFAGVRVPDEYYVQSLVTADPDLRWVEGDTTCCSFPDGSTSPSWLTSRLLTELAASTGAPFARKMPVGASAALVAAADALASGRGGDE